MKFIPKAAALLCALLLIVGTIPTARAENTSVTYSGGAERFVFLPENLFDPFQQLMPGSVSTQTIHIRNARENEVKVRLYLRAEAVDAQWVPFLKQVRLTVAQGDRRIFDASADEQDDLRENVLLGTFYSGGETDLTVTLTVPTGVGNDYQNARGQLRWVFTAEELPVVPEDPDPPPTGSTDTVQTIAAVCAFAFAGAILAFFRLKHHKQP